MKLEDILLNYSIVDLTHCLDENVPVWPDGVVCFERQMIEDYDYNGYRCFKFSQSEGVGTHMDAPAHFLKGGDTISDIDCSQLILLANVIDVRDKVLKNNDYKISADDILDWERRYKKISENSLVLGFTGWSKYWDDKSRYLNCDSEGVMHFPGFSESAARLLIERNVAGVGIDTLSIDAGIDASFIAHKIILGNSKYQLENLCNLDKMPAYGSVVIAMPIKIKSGSEAPSRVVALKKKED